MLHIPGLFIQPNPKGRGMYTAEDLQPGDLIEICPVLKIPEGQLDHIGKTILHDYYFVWEEEGIAACIALGFGSLYNHSPTPNAIVIMDYVDEVIRIKACTVIISGEEILIDYKGGTSDVELWFAPE